MAESKSEARKRLLEKFRDVAIERVTAVSSSWVGLEQAADDSALADEVARQLHTLKGEARTLGLKGPLALAERLEELFHRARAVAFQLPAQVGDAFLSGMDGVGALLLLPLCDGAVSAELLERLETARRDIPEHEGVEQNMAPPSAPEAAPPRREESLRVLPSRVVALSELALELRVGQGQMEFLVAGLRERLARAGALLDELRVAQGGQGHAHVQELTELVRGTLRTAIADGHALEEVRHQQDLQASALDVAARELRLVPLASLLVAYPRSVRDLAAELGKQAALTLEGDALEADKRVLEALEEPLLHLLRNALDHGIETPDQRVKRGKPLSGQIRVVARQPQPDRIALSVEDDGSGVDLSALRRRAVERNVVSEEAAAALSDDEALQLIFHQGLSTRTAVGALSGRGVGMEIVKRRVEDLGGSVTLENRPGRGMRTTLTVPISVSLSHVLLLRLGERTLALPASGVDRVMRVEAREIREGPRGLFLGSGEELIPLVPLGELLEWRTGGSEEQSLAIVLRSGAERMAISVDRILGEVELVVRPLERPLRGARGLSGAGVLPSGQLALVLKIADLMTWRHERCFAPSVRHRQVARRALVVDDSFVFRNLLNDLLTGLGFVVSEAEDGRQAFELLGALVPDVLVTDLQMPRLDGFGLMQQVRSDPRWHRLPVVAVSTLSSAPDRRRAMEAGADAFLVKTELDESSIARTLARLLDSSPSTLVR